jgi:hypothetical protein
MNNQDFHSHCGTDGEQVTRCVSRARRDLCGGRQAIAVPTATGLFQ